MLRSSYQFKARMAALSARRKRLTFDTSDFVWLSVSRIVGYFINARSGDYIPRFVCHIMASFLLLHAQQLI